VARFDVSKNPDYNVSPTFWKYVKVYDGFEPEALTSKDYSKLNYNFIGKIVMKQSLFTSRKKSMERLQKIVASMGGHEVILHGSEVSSKKDFLPSGKTQKDYSLLGIPIRRLCYGEAIRRTDESLEGMFELDETFVITTEELFGKRQSTIKTKEEIKGKPVAQQKPSSFEEFMTIRSIKAYLGTNFKWEIIKGIEDVFGVSGKEEVIKIVEDLSTKKDSRELFKAMFGTLKKEEIVGVIKEIYGKDENH
jgi:hypothetical protein